MRAAMGHAARHGEDSTRGARMREEHAAVANAMVGSATAGPAETA